MAQPPETEPFGVTLVTLSFEGDFSLCRLLCETIDRFVPSDVQHVVAVPRADLGLFNALADPRRAIVTQESLLPPWLHKLPLPSRAWRRRLRLPRRNVYLSTRGWPVRGWIAQQMMKLTAASTVETDLILNVDSDAAFIRPFVVGSLWRNNQARLLRVPGEGDLPTHRKWHQAASQLLGLPSTRYHGADYIDNLVTWRRPIVRALLNRIETVGGGDPLRILAGMTDFSEYVLYGIFCDKIIGLNAAGHYGAPTSLCETIWSRPPEGGGRRPDLSIVADKPTIGIQSTIAMSDQERRSIVERAIATASRADGSTIS